MTKNKQFKIGFCELVVYSLVSSFSIKTQHSEYSESHGERKQVGPMFSTLMESHFVFIFCSVNCFPNTPPPPPPPPKPQKTKEHQKGKGKNKKNPIQQAKQFQLSTFSTWQARNFPLVNWLSVCHI